MNTSTIRQPQPQAPEQPAPSRMTFSNVRKGVIRAPLRVLIYGPEGIGKSTFASGAPKPIYIGSDTGTLQLNVDRFPEPRTFPEAIQAVRQCRTEKHEYETLVIDPINWLEPLCAKHVLGDSGKSLEDWGGGFGRGYSAMLEHWRELTHELESVWSQRQMHIVITAHSTIKMFQDPLGSGYDRFEIAMHKNSAGLFKQWVDYVLFAKHESYAKADAQTKKLKGLSSGARVLHTSWSAAYDAKSRGRLPEELPLSWSAFFNAVQSQEDQKIKALEQIEEGLLAINDAATTAKVREYVAAADNNADRIVEIANAVANKVAEHVARQQ